MTPFEILLTASSALSLVGGAVAVWAFRKILEGLETRIRYQFDSAYTAVFTRLVRAETGLSLHMSRVAHDAREHAEALATAAKVDVKRIEDFLQASVAGDYKEVLSLKADLLSEVKALHNRIQSAETAATKGYETAKNGLVEAARSVMIAPRRVCGWCDRLVHSFETQADGSAKCIDCKAAGR